MMRNLGDGQLSWLTGGSRHRFKRPAGKFLAAWHGHMHRSAEYDRWRHDAGWVLRAQRPPEVQGWVGLKICAVIPERRRDLDNLNQALADLLVEHRVLQDDAYVASIDARWDKTVASGPRAPCGQDHIGAPGAHQLRHAQAHQGGQWPPSGDVRAGG
jgi:Holliday junction resolvase RusA-like endonuclease